MTIIRRPLTAMLDEILSLDEKMDNIKTSFTRLSDREEKLELRKKTVLQQIEAIAKRDAVDLSSNLEYKGHFFSVGSYGSSYNRSYDVEITKPTNITKIK